MTEKLLVFTLVFVSIPLALCQNRTILFDDNSVSGGPVSLSGNVTFNSTQARLNVTGYNGSKLGILAIVTTFDVAPIIFSTETHDHFFKEMLVSAPLSNFQVGETGQYPLNTPEVLALVAKSNRAFGKVLWVQFSDGSIWGDPKIGEQIFADRAKLRLFLTSLVDAWTQGGENAFKSVLSSGSDPSIAGVVMKLQAMVKSSDVLTTVTLIRGRLAIGATRPQSSNP